jgi:hypothetical protein
MPFAHWFVEVQYEPAGPPPARTHVAAPVEVFVTSQVSVALHPHWGATPHAWFGAAVTHEPASAPPELELELDELVEPDDDDDDDVDDVEPPDEELVEPPEEDDALEEVDEVDPPEDDVDDELVEPPPLDPLLVLVPGSVPFVDVSIGVPPLAHATTRPQAPRAPDIQTRAPPRRAFIGRALTRRNRCASFDYIYLQDASGVSGAKFAPPAGRAASMSTSAVSRIALISA